MGVRGVGVEGRRWDWEAGLARWGLGEGALVAILWRSRECSNFRGGGGGGVGEPGEGRDIFQKERLGIICPKT